MNELDFDKQDREVMAAVNGEPEGAPRILPKRTDVDVMARIKAERIRRHVLLGLRVAACLLAAALFLAMLLDPAWVPVMAYAGIMIFVVVAAIMVDRHFFRRGKWLK